MNIQSSKSTDSHNSSQEPSARNIQPGQSSDNTQEQAPVRIDVWLWAVRIFKTRSLANSEVKAGHIRINDEHIKPSQKVKYGDIVRVRYPGWERVFEVKKTLTKRVGAPVAVTCYNDLSEPRPAYLSAGVLPRRERGSGRPTKNQRRELNKLRGYEKQ